MNDDKNNFITLKQAAFYLRISLNAMRIRKYRKTLPVKVHLRGGRLFVGVEEIEEFYRSGGWDAFAKRRDV